MAVDLFEEKMRQAILRGAQHLIEHGLNDWKVGLHSKRKVLADCNNRTKTIRFSKNFITIATPEQFDGVTLHEIAHALVGAGHGHDRTFRMKAMAIGAGVDYSSANVGKPVETHKYNLECPECGATSRTNTNKRYICRSCSKEGKRIPFNVTENVLKVVMWPVPASTL